MEPYQAKKGLFQNYFKQQENTKYPQQNQVIQDSHLDKNIRLEVPVEKEIEQKQINQVQQVINLNEKKLVQKILPTQLTFPDIFQEQFLTYIVGPPGSGKSSILNELISNNYLYGNYFQQYLFVSPNKFSDLQIEDVNWIKDINLYTIYSRILECNKSKAKNIRMCIVFDDVISQIAQLSRDKLMCSLILNRRHLLENGCEISLFITSQKYNMLPLKFRVQITSAILFYVCQKEWQDIKQEIIKSNDLRQIQKIIEKECTGSHKFVYIHNNNPIKIFNHIFKEIIVF